MFFLATACGIQFDFYYPLKLSSQLREYMTFIASAKMASFIEALNLTSLSFAHNLKMELKAIEPTVERIHCASIDIFGMTLDRGSVYPDNPRSITSSRRFNMTFSALNKSNLAKVSDHILKMIKQVVKQVIRESVQSRTCKGYPFSSLHLTCNIKLELDVWGNSSAFLGRSVFYQS
jgi:hypothetical protein